MMVKSEPWISANEAAEIISKNSGRTIHPDYVRLLARQNPQKLASKPLDGRTNVYLRSDVEQITVKAKRMHTEVVAQPVKNAPIEEKAVDWTPEPEPSQNRIVEPKSDNPSNWPVGSMKRADFCKANGINEGDFGKWKKSGWGLEETEYMHVKNRLSYYLTIPQQAHSLMILRQRGKLT